MPLQQFTIRDRSTITTVLKLPSIQLEDGSRLYSELEKIEDRDRRLPGLNLVTEIKMLLNEIRLIRQDINDLENAEPDSMEFGIDLHGLKRVSVDDEYTLDVANSDGMVGSLGSKNRILEKKLNELRDFLDYPWEVDTFPVLWVG